MIICFIEKSARQRATAAETTSLGAANGSVVLLPPSSVAAVLSSDSSGETRSLSLNDGSVMVFVAGCM
jgi:hypothetical protein